MNRPLKKNLALSSVSLLLGSQTLLPPLPVQAQSAVRPDPALGCPAGTIESPNANLINNGTFTISPGVVGPLPDPNPASFTSNTPYRGDGVYPSDDVGGLSIQNGSLTDPTTPTTIVSGRGVTAAEATQAGVGNTPISTYLYSNPNANAATPNIPQSAFPNPFVWRQTVRNLLPNTTYNFKGLFFNLLLPSAGGAPPRIRLQVSTDATITSFIEPTTTLNVGDGSSIPGFPNIANTRQAWVPTQFAFTTGPNQTVAVVQILDEANDVVGDDFGFTALGLRQCIPNTPTLGVAKQAGTPTQNANGTYTIPYTLRVSNLSPAGQSPQLDLFNLQLTDNLAQTFVTATLNAVTNIQSATLSVNAGFNGSTNQNLLQGTDTLAAGATAIVTFNVNITPGTGANGLGPFDNTTIARATNQLSSPVTDQSNNGANVDPDNDGNPGNNNTPTRVSLIPTSSGGAGAFRLVKRITNVIRNGAQLSGVNFSAFIDGTGDDDNATGFAQLQPGNAPIGQINLDPITAKLQSGDDVEYSIYYLSDGTGPAIGVSLCDPVPLNTSLVANTTQVQRNNGTIATGGTVFAPLAPLPSGNTCPDANNQNGTVIFDLGDIPNTAGSNFGLVRFRVRVN